jgi:hypothetical protein
MCLRYQPTERFDSSDTVVLVDVDGRLISRRFGIYRLLGLFDAVLVIRNVRSSQRVGTVETVERSLDWWSRHGIIKEEGMKWKLLHGYPLIRLDEWFWP